MVERVLANDIDNGHLGTACVVEVGNSVCKTGPEMKQGAGWLFSHARVTIRGCRYYSFKKSEYGPHPGRAVQGSHDMHFRRARIGEADFDASSHKRPNQGFCAVHVQSLPVSARFLKEISTAKSKLHAKIAKLQRQASHSVPQGFPSDPRERSRPQPPLPASTRSLRDHPGNPSKFRLLQTLWGRDKSAACTALRIDRRFRGSVASPASKTRWEDAGLAHSHCRRAKRTTCAQKV